MPPANPGARGALAALLSALLSVQLSVVGAMQVAGAEPIASNLRALGVPPWARVTVGLARIIHRGRPCPSTGAARGGRASGN
jgi:hypothetical protein